MNRMLVVGLAPLFVAGATLADTARTQDPAATPRPTAQGPTAQGSILTALDRDGDGELSAAEVADASAALRALDRNGDGAVSRSELRRGPGAARPASSRRGPGGRDAGASPARIADNPPRARTDAERRALEVLAELDRSRRRMNVPQQDGRLLRILVESTRAKRVVELGTYTGYSATWIALGLRATGGELITHEIDADVAKTAKQNLERAGVADRVKIVVGDAHQTVDDLQGPIDIVFIDADKSGYLDYLQKLLPRVRDGGLILSHNMNRPTPDAAFVEAITTDPALETLFLHMDAAGIGVTLKKGARAE